MIQFINVPERELIAHARDVVTNSLISELSKEDPQGQGEYKDAVRHQIVATFQRLRLLLLVIDHLMEIYTSTP